MSKKNRNIAAPETNIIRYAIKEKGILSLQNESSEISLEEESYRPQQNVGRNADFLYLLLRKNASEDGKSLPGWMGFNTQVYKEIRSLVKSSHRCSSYGHINRQHAAPTQCFDLPTPSCPRSCLSFRRNNIRQSSND